MAPERCWCHPDRDIEPSFGSQLPGERTERRCRWIRFEGAVGQQGVGGAIACLPPKLPASLGSVTPGQPAGDDSDNLAIEFRALLRRKVDRSHAALQIGRSEEHTSDLQSLMRISYAL